MAERGRPIEIFNHLSLQQRILARAMIDAHTTQRFSPTACAEYAIAYHTDRGGGKIMDKCDALTPAEQHQLVEIFLRDPKDVLAVGRQNLISIMRDERLKQAERVDRLARYLQEFVDLNVVLDNLAFPPDQVVHSGVPEYIRDQLRDLGRDPEPDPRKRTGREIMAVDKKNLYKDETLRAFLMDLYTRIGQTQLAADSTKVKQAVVMEIAKFVHTILPYDHRRLGYHDEQHFRSIHADEVVRQRLGVCRHHAFITQQIYQLMGMTSRLIKCNYWHDGRNLGAHGCNAFRINGNWHLQDVTNPRAVAIRYYTRLALKNPGRARLLVLRRKRARHLRENMRL